VARHGEENNEKRTAKLQQSHMDKKWTHIGTAGTTRYVNVLKFTRTKFFLFFFESGKIFLFQP